MHPAVERAQRFADDVLFPAALATDAADLVPRANLDRLAAEGLYGMAGPQEAGGLGLDLATANAVIEALAGGCLSTTFVWIQHHSGVRAVARSQTPGLREEWLAPMCRGDVRGGIARAGEIPGPPRLSVTRTADGLVLNGEAPWVTGWGRIDVMLVVAREGEQVVRMLMDASPAATIEAERLHLVGTDASGTFTLTFRDHVVPPTRIVETEALADVIARDPSTLRTNGSLALGVAGRCVRLLGPTDLDERGGAHARSARRRRPRGPAGGARAGGRTVAADGGRAHHRPRGARHPHGPPRAAPGA